MPSDLSIRVAVGNSTGPRSSVWRIWTNKNEVYAAHRTLAHIEKLSFHSSGICRRAFTNEQGTTTTMTDRVIDKWRRAEVTLLLLLAFLPLLY
jgi:hypothetical protein